MEAEASLDGAVEGKMQPPGLVTGFQAITVRGGEGRGREGYIGTVLLSVTGLYRSGVKRKALYM